MITIINMRNNDKIVTSSLRILKVNVSFQGYDICIYNAIPQTILQLPEGNFQFILRIK